MGKFQNKKDFIIRLVVFILGMFVSCYGIAITTRSMLGTTPIASPYYAISLFNIKYFDFGMCAFIFNALFFFGQVLILRKNFPPIQIVQLPIALATGLFISLSMFLTQFIHAGAYWWNILLIIIGSAIIGLGIAMEVWADLTYMPGDGLVKVIYEVSKLNFGVVKVSFDVTLVVMAMLITYFGLGEIFGQCVREGTLISALTVGVFADMFLKLTGIEFINFIADIYKVPVTIRKKRIKLFGERFGLSDVLDKPMQGYSHGTRQKMMVVAALVHDPAVWILDEPLIGLDPTSAFELKKMMREHADKGNAVFFSTHVLEVAEKLCDRIAIIDKGKIVFVGTLKELKDKYDKKDLEKLFMEVIKND